MSEYKFRLGDVFYPAQKKLLQHKIASIFENVKDTDFKADRLRALIVPHAGLDDSGDIVADGYKIIKQISSRIQNIILIGPSHKYHFGHIAYDNSKIWKTPLGDISLDYSQYGQLIKNLKVVEDSRKFEYEHSFEIQSLFVQSILNKHSITPFCLGQNVDDKFFADYTLELIDDDTIVIGTCDFTADRDNQSNSKILDALIERDWNTIVAMGAEGTCSLETVKIITRMALKNNWKVKLINSKFSSKDEKGKVKIFAAIGFYF